MKKVITMMAAFCILATLFPVQLSNASDSQVKATWLWNPYELVSQSSEVLTFLQSNQVTDVFLQIDRDLPHTIYQSFIERASEQNINIHALDGAPTWATQKGSAEYQPLINWLRSYQSLSTENQRFSGIHTDVEPYLLSEWNTSRQKTILYYQNSVKAFQNLAQELNIAFAADIPFWFDEISFQNKSYGNGLLSNWVQANTDIVTIMAYRNFADGPNGIIQLSNNEIITGSKLGKKVVIGVETGYSEEGSHLSFYNNGRATMETELTKVNDAFNESTSYHGIAIHHYASWKELK
ncbi:amidase [Bacillus suaedae]|uniref:Amidase n=1 Tax=Halalkalibacter suaedae TaxID=2822140 RepID=A0A940WXW6_9BACI|nr:amidase [Bacillus suaedae]MBP3950361.1 amidase [Bacillus suaedae]